MAEAGKNQKSAQHSAEKGIISVVFIRITQFFIFLLLTLFFSIIIEWAGMMMGIWDEPGAKHSEQMLQQELIYLNDDFKRSAIVKEPIKFAHHFANQFYLYLFEKTGFKKAIIWAASAPQSKKTGSFRNRLHTLYKKTQARHATSRNFGTPVAIIHSPTQRMGDALAALRPSQLRTKPCSVKTTSMAGRLFGMQFFASLARC